MTEDSTIDDVIERCYETLSFAEGAAPDWSAFRAAYIDRAMLALRVFPGDPDVQLLDLDGYVTAQMRDDLAEHGYEERPGERSVSVFGDVAQVVQRFEMRFPDGSVSNAVDLFSLVRTADMWQIVSVVSDIVPASRASGEATND